MNEISLTKTEVAIEEVGVASAVAREQSEILAATMTAHKFPRNETAARTKALNSFERLSMAEAAQYKFPRGGKQISGPSIDMAVECARCWRNIRQGLRIVKVGEETVHIKGYACDLETNSYVEFEDEFEKLVQRKINGQTMWVKPDERDLRELINRRGAILVRNAILRVLPPDLIEDCIGVSENTLKKANEKSLKDNPKETLNKLAFGFSRFGVTADMLEKYIGNKLDAITPEQLTDLLKIYNSIKDGQSKREEHFDVGAMPSDSPAVNDLNAAVKAKKQAQTVEA